jgi:hypothetical protein
LVGNKSLKQVLRDCYEQANSILSPVDRQNAEETGIDSYVGVTAMKGGVVQAFLMESLVSADGLPWSIKPTPIPDLSEQGRQEALQLVKEQIFNDPAMLASIMPQNPGIPMSPMPVGFPPITQPVDQYGMGAPMGGGLVQPPPLTTDPAALISLVKDMKERVKAEEYKQAELAALKMEKLMFDQCAEGGWRQAMAGFIYNFVFYPYGIIHGPVPTRRPRLSWVKDKVRTKMETFYKWESISPWDFWYSPDSRDTQSGTGIFLRKRLTKRHLYEMCNMKSYLRSNVEQLLEDTKNDENYPFRWLSSNPDQPDNYITSWHNCTATIDQLTHYGYVSGRELAEYGLTGLEATKFYDATITVIGGYVVQVFIAPDPTVNIRPVFTASFYRTRDRIPNFGISQRLRDIDKSYASAYRFMLRNMAFASEPIVEMDRTKLAKYMDADLEFIDPGQVFIVDNEMSGRKDPALFFHTIPNAMQQFSQVLDFLMDSAHLMSNVPAGLHGTAVGSGANRTFRGMANLQSNAVKSLQAAVGNIDETVFLPMGELLYNYNMLYEEDMAIKGDSKVMAQGVLGLFAREMERNNALELLQLIGSIGAQLGDKATPLLDWALQRALIAMRVPEELAKQAAFGEARSPEPPAAPQQQSAPPVEAGAAPASPVPPPAPAPGVPI